MPLPIKPEDIKNLVAEEKQKGFLTTVVLPPGVKPREMTIVIIDLLGFNKVVAHGLKVPLNVRVPDLYEKAVQAFENGKLLKARVLVNKIDIIDVLETEEVDPETLEHDVYTVSLSPYGSLILEKDGKRFFLKPLTENAKDLASLLALHTDGIGFITVKMIVQKLGTLPDIKATSRGSIEVLNAALFAWKPEEGETLQQPQQQEQQQGELEGDEIEAPDQPVEEPAQEEEDDKPVPMPRDITAEDMAFLEEKAKEMLGLMRKIDDAETDEEAEKYKARVTEIVNEAYKRNPTLARMLVETVKARYESGEG